VKGDSKAMGFVPNGLDKVQQGRVRIQTDWVLFPPFDKDDFFTLGN
jgi:hypothetical protein